MKSNQIFQKTKESSNRRRKLYLLHAKEPESKLLDGSLSKTTFGNTIMSISHFYSNLNTYEAEIKTKHEIFTISNNDCASPCPSLIPPVSSGEESLCLSEDQEKLNKRVLSLKEICSYLIDSTLLKIDKPTPKKIYLNQLQDFDYYARKANNANDKSKELLFWDIRESIENERIIYDFLKEIFNQTTGEKAKLHVTRIKLLFYKGKYSAIIRFGDPETAAYLYYNFSNPHKAKTREVLGNSFSVYYVTENNIKIKRNDWIAVVMRGLNQKIEKKHITDRLKEKLNLVPIWMEDIVTIKHHKYALFGVSSIEEAEAVCKHFKNSNDIRDKIKANIHPRSSKIRKSIPPKLLRFLTYKKPLAELDPDLDQSRDRSEADTIKEQLMQKVLDLKSSGKLSSSVFVSNSLPDLINAFNQEDSKMSEDKKPKEKELKMEEENQHKRQHSRHPESKHHTTYFSKSYYRHAFKEKLIPEKNRNSSTEENTKNRSKSKRKRSRSRSRSHSASKHSRSKERKNHRYVKPSENAPSRRHKEKSSRRSRSKRSKTRSLEKERGKYASKTNKNLKKTSKSRSYSMEKRYYKKKSQSVEKRYSKNDSKEKYRKKYGHNLENNKEKEVIEKDENLTKFLPRNYKYSYKEPLDKFNNNKAFEKGIQNNDENNKRSIKTQKTSILDRINKGTQNLINNKDNTVKKDGCLYRQRYAIYDEIPPYLNSYVEERSQHFEENQARNESKDERKQMASQENSSEVRIKPKN